MPRRERLLEYGFREFEEYQVYEAGQTVREADVWFGAAAHGAARGRRYRRR